jgi:hypothetical protein
MFQHFRGDAQQVLQLDIHGHGPESLSPAEDSATTWSLAYTQASRIAQ